MEIKKRMIELSNLLERYNYYYYTKNESLVSDIEYDNLMKELKELERKYPEYKEENSVTSRVGAINLKESKFQKIAHKKPMLSLANSYNEGEIIDFIERIKKLLPEYENLKYALELKLDGLSISLIYENGKLVKAITRGDGEIGEDVTENILQINSIPKYLKENIDIEIRGEIVLPLSKFEELNKKRLENGEEIFANPRNAASGTLRQLDEKIIAQRGLEGYFYFVVDAQKYGINSHRESIEYLEKLGIQTTGVCEILDNSKFLMERIEYWGKERENLDYETDGMVIKLDNIEFWEKLGNTTKTPRWAIAFKFPAKQVTTKINGVTWQVGRTGKVTPVAELEEVELSGSRVKRASLHNFQEIQRKDIRIGDTVFIEKAAEIIPQVVKSVKENRNGSEIEIVEPSYCPVCNTLLSREDGIVDIKCINPKCPAKIEGELLYFVSRDAMNISGFGNRLVENFLKLGFISDITDIYNLKTHRESLVNLEKLGEKSIDNLLSAIEESKNREYEKVLCALGIQYVGKTSAKILANYSKNIDKLMEMEIEELSTIDGIGEKMAQSIYDYFRDEENIRKIEKLKDYGVNFQTKEIKNNEEQIFVGKTFLFTGTLKNFTRDEIKEKIEKMGGKNLSAVSKNLDYLIIGEKAGSKLKKAQELGTIKIITEDEFLNMCK